MINKISSFGGYSNTVGYQKLNLQEPEDKVEEIKQWQPNSRLATFGHGPEAWRANTYVRTREIFGRAAVAQGDYALANKKASTNSTTEAVSNPEVTGKG